MEFIITKEKERYLNIQRSKVFERFDQESLKHIFSIRDEDNKSKDIFTISAKTGELEWLENIDNELKEDDEVKNVISIFQDTTRLINGDKAKIKDWLKENFDNYNGMGFVNEYYISVTSPNIDSDKIWWDVKRQRSFTPGGELGMPVFVVRYTKDEESDAFSIFGEPGTPQDLYIGDDGEFIPEEIIDTIFKDINQVCSDVYDLTIDFRYRIPS